MGIVGSETCRRETGAIKVSVFGLSDIGGVRDTNEDSLAVCDLSTGEMNPFSAEHPLGRQGLLLLVADGMGGETCGEVASNLCAELIPKRLMENLTSPDEFSPAQLGWHLQE